MPFCVELLMEVKEQVSSISNNFNYLKGYSNVIVEYYLHVRK